MIPEEHKQTVALAMLFVFMVAMMFWMLAVAGGPAGMR